MVILVNSVIYEILNSIESQGFKAYLVGGYVRDYILGFLNLDVDIVTNAPVNILLNLFSDNNPKVFQYNTIKFACNEFHIDIAQMREEHFDGNKTIVNFTDDLQKDFTRRDFTMNAIYLDKDLNFFDFSNCISDCKNLTLNFIGNSNLKCYEDPIRFIRGIYLILKYNIKDYTSLNGISITQKDFKRCSHVALINIIYKILKLNKNEEFVNLLDKYNLYQELFDKRPNSFELTPKEFLIECEYLFIV